MKPVHKFVWALMVSLALLLSGCGGSSGSGDSAGALSAEEQAKMARAKTQMDALKMAYDAAVAALVTLEDDFSDATQAEIDDVEAKLTALKAADTAAVDVSAGDKAMYSVQAIETRLAAGKKSARLALAAEVADKAKMERAETQVAALKMAYEAAVAALETLESDTSDATKAEVDDAQAKLDALKAAVAAAADVSADVKAMYPAQMVEDRLTEAKKDARLALEAEAARKAREEAEAVAKEARAAPQRTALKAAYEAAEDAVALLEKDTSDATQAELEDAKDKLAALVTLRGNDPETGTPDVSDEVKEMYPADTLQTRLDKAEKLARVALFSDGVKVAAGKAMDAAGTAIMNAGTAIMDAGTAIEGAETAVEGLVFIRIQTGSGSAVAQDVEKARKAYNDAKTAYETAKMAYDTAKEKHDMDRDAADTIEKANALKVAADAAKTAADAAKTAADAAKTAADAAKMKAETDVETAKMSALRYEDGAYRIGDTSSINPTTIGKTVTTEGEKTTGFIEIIGGDSLNNDGAATTSEKTGQVALAASEFAVGGKYDSADDNTRLRLITHYVSNPGEPGALERVGVYYFQTDDSEANLVKSTPVEPGVVDEQKYPGLGYGFATDVGNADRRISKTKLYDFPIYPVTGSDGSALTGNLTGANLASYHILDAAAAKPIDRGSEPVFYAYLEEGTTWQYLQLVRTETDNDGTPTYVFRKLKFLSNAGSYPKLNAYEHINYGIWSTLDEDGETSADLGIGFVRELKAGGMTTPANLPTTGSATYHGKWVANILSRPTDGGKITEHHGRAKVTAEFTGDRTVTVNLVKGDNFDGGGSDDAGQNLMAYGTLAVLEGTITSGTSQFKGTKVTNVSTGVNNSLSFGDLSQSATGSTGDEPAYTGTFSGAFFGNKIGDEGENASEVGGVFDFTSEKNDDGVPKNGAFRGSFGGRNITKPAAEDDDS